MPGNEVEDVYRRLYQLEKCLQEQNSSAVFGGNWSVLDQNSLAQNLTQIGALQNPNLKTYGLQQLGTNDFCVYGVPIEKLCMDTIKLVLQSCVI